MHVSACRRLKYVCDLCVFRFTACICRYFRTATKRMLTEHEGGTREMLTLNNASCSCTTIALPLSSPSVLSPFTYLFPSLILLDLSPFQCLALAIPPSRPSSPCSNAMLQFRNAAAPLHAAAPVARKAEERSMNEDKKIRFAASET